MRETEQSTPTRRAVLSTIGTGLTAGVLGTEAMAQQGRPQYALEQGDNCVAVQPLRGQLLADEFYDFQLPEQYVTAANGAFVGDAAPYSSVGTLDLQRAQTSIAFLYRSPGGLYLVVVHGSVEAPDAGAVTFRLSGLPEDGEWIVKDDLYRDPDTGEIADTNYDRWDVDGTDHRIDWTWGSSGTDGGVFGDLGDDFEIVIDPAFNEAAALYGEHYEGTITDWEFVSGLDGGERFSLDLDEPIRIRTGRCAGSSQSRGTTRQTEQQVEQEQEVEVEQEQNTSEQETERNQQNQQEGEQSQQQDVEQSQQQDGEVEQSQEAEIEQEQETEGERDDEEDEDDEDDDDDEEEEREAEEEEEDDEDDDDDDDDDERGRGNGRGSGNGSDRGDEGGEGRDNEERGDEDEDEDDDDD